MQYVPVDPYHAWTGEMWVFPYDLPDIFVRIRTDPARSVECSLLHVLLYLGEWLGVIFEPLSLLLGSLFRYGRFYRKTHNIL